MWNLSFGVLEGQDSQAVVVNGTVYVTTSFNRVIAADGTTGKILWKYERELPGDVFPKLCCDVVNRGVAVYKNKVYLATPRRAHRGARQPDRQGGLGQEDG